MALTFSPSHSFLTNLTFFLWDLVPEFCEDLNYNIMGTFDFGSLISGGTGLISGVMSMLGARRNVERQIKAQREENERTRQYNLMLARQQNAWNVEQYEREQQDYLNNWNRQNSYDSPAAQMQRYKDAGLNPNLIYDKMTSSPQIDTSSVSGSLTAGDSASSADMSALGRLPTFGDALQQSVDTALKQAQIAKLKADTKNTEEDTRGKESDNRVKVNTEQVRQAIIEGNLQMQHLEIEDLGFKVDELNPAQLKKVTADINKAERESALIIEKSNLIKQQITGQEIQNEILKIEKELKRPMMQAKIKQYSVEYRLTEAQIRTMIETLPYKIMGLDQDWQHTAVSSNLLQKQFDSMTFKNDRLTFDYRWDKAFDVLGMVAKFMDVLARIFGPAGRR